MNRLRSHKSTGYSPIFGRVPALELPETTDALSPRANVALYSGSGGATATG